MHWRSLLCFRWQGYQHQTFPETCCVTGKTAAARQHTEYGIQDCHLNHLGDDLCGHIKEVIGHTLEE
jgi:hypothetical protein